MITIDVLKIDNVYMKINCLEEIEFEISEHFKFRTDGYQYMQAYKNGSWDGYKRLFDRRNNKLYIGLLDKLRQFCIDKQYKLNEDPRLTQISDISEEQLNYLIEEIKLKPKFIPYDYQRTYIKKALEKNRCICKSPTASGKSLIIFSIIKSLLNQDENYRVLIVVPKVNLVSQLAKDFQDYCAEDISNDIHQIYSGQEKHVKQRIVITTWQSIAKNMPQDWFDQFQIVCADEVHRFDAACCTEIMSRTRNACFKYGFSGTLKKAIWSKWLLEGLFGEVIEEVKTFELIDMNIASDLKITGIILSYPDEVKKLFKKVSYQDEIKFILSNKKRIELIINLATKLPKNTLILFRTISYGKLIYKELQKCKDNVFYIAGEVKVSDREIIREDIDFENKNATLIASYGTFAEGINIKNIHNIIFVHPIKGEIEVPQTIGRGLRKADDGSMLNILDIVDDISWKRRKNYALKHFFERTKLYDEAKFNYSIKNIIL